MAHALAGIDGSLVAIATPFRDTQLDEEALARLCARQIARGTAAIVVCGSTGEASALSSAEHARAIRVVVETAGGRVPVIAGCTAVATAKSVFLANEAARAGADALLCAAPPYGKPTQDGIIAHIRAVAHASALPVVLYDVPSRVGVAIADTTIAQLFKRELIVAIKDATGDLSRPPRLRALCGDRLAQFTGEDASAAAHRAMGGVGCISVTANIAPALCARLHRAWDNADLATFSALRDRLDPLHRVLFAESNPIPLKAALAELGLCGDALRLPLTRATEATRQQLRSVLPAVMAAEEQAAAPLRYALAS